MLNRCGGRNLLGVRDDGSIEGVDDPKEQQMTLDKDMNNPQLIRPSIFLHHEDILVDDKHVVLVTVPESPHIHTYKGDIWDRSGEGDFIIKSDDAIAAHAWPITNKWGQRAQRATYILNLLLSIINLSLQTNELVAQLPELKL